MKKFRLVLVVIVFILINNCEQFGIAGQSGIKGREVKRRIDTAIGYTTFLRASLFKDSGNTGLSIGVERSLAISLTKVENYNNYRVESVEDCENKIKSIGLILGNIIPAIQCDLKTSPIFFEAGPIEVF